MRKRTFATSLSCQPIAKRISTLFASLLLIGSLTGAAARNAEATDRYLLHHIYLYNAQGVATDVSSQYTYSSGYVFNLQKSPVFCYGTTGGVYDYAGNSVGFIYQP